MFILSFLLSNSGLSNQGTTEPHHALPHPKRFPLQFLIASRLQRSRDFCDLCDPTGKVLYCELRFSKLIKGDTPCISETAAGNSRREKFSLHSHGKGEGARGAVFVCWVYFLLQPVMGVFPSLDFQVPCSEPRDDVACSSVGVSLTLEQPFPLLPGSFLACPRKDKNWISCGL